MTIKRILSIDSGGIKGVAVCSFLYYLDLFLQESGTSLFDFFDIYIGTSTGALIVSSIAYEKMSGSDLINKLYIKENILKMMSGSEIHKDIRILSGKPKYDGVGKKEIIEKYCRNKLMQDSNGKDVMITTLKIADGVYNNGKKELKTHKKEPLVFKSWVDSAYKLSEICDASSSAPSYFPSTTVNKLTAEYVLSGFIYQNILNEYMVCVDGALFAANPTMCAYVEALKKYGPNTDIRILSIGAGIYQNEFSNDNAGMEQWLFDGDITGLLLASPQVSVHQNVENLAKTLGHKYVRVNGFVPDYSLDDIKDSNISALKKAGETWWNIYCYDVIKQIYEEQETIYSKIIKMFKPLFQKNNDDNLIYY